MALDFGLWILDIRLQKPDRLRSGPHSEIKNPKSQITPALPSWKLIIVLAILSVLTAAAVPMMRNSVKRERESELRSALRELRRAIDRYKKYHDDSNGTAIPLELKTPTGYPKELKVLVEGFIPANTVGLSGNRVRFMRRLPNRSNHRQ